MVIEIAPPFKYFSHQKRRAYYPSLNSYSYLMKRQGLGVVVRLITFFLKSIYRLFLLRVEMEVVQTNQVDSGRR